MDSWLVDNWAGESMQVKRDTLCQKSSKDHENQSVCFAKQMKKG